jgi:magnesium transporter
MPPESRARPPADPPPEPALPHGQRRRLLLRLLRHPHDRQLRRLLPRVHPADIAPLFPLLKPAERQRLLQILFELRLATRTLRELDPEIQPAVLAEVPDDRLAAMLARLSLDDAADLLHRLDEERRERLLTLVEPATAARLRNLLRYGEETAGGLMNPDVPAFSIDATVGETIAALRRLAESRRLFYLYVVDPEGHLVGLVNLWKLTTAEGDQRLGEVMGRDIVTVRVDTPQEEVARVFARYDLLILPVVDEDGRLAGAITVDDVLYVVEQEATEDLYRLANLNVQDGLATPAARAVRLRLPWLLANLGTAFLAAGVVHLFAETIAKYVVLAVFMPIVAGMGGNAGTQTLTVMVRGAALGEMELHRTRSVIARQIAIGLLNGLATGAVLAAVAWVWERNAVLSGILFVAETANLTLAGLFGAAVPILLRRLRLDPALGSSILVTTVTDCGGFLIFLGTATLLARHLL